MERIKELASTFFYLGYSPFVPGTMGTLGAMALAFLLFLLPPGVSYGAVSMGIVLLSLALGVPLGSWAEKRFGKKDPGPFVLDEVMGYFVPLCLYMRTLPAPDELFAAFILFRLFDIAKPMPARKMEQLPGGWGIMLDDLVAGLVALAGLSVYHAVRLNPTF